MTPWLVLSTTSACGRLWLSLCNTILQRCSRNHALLTW